MSQIVQLVGLYTTNILLAQNDCDAGSASALINFSVNIFGVVGMGLALCSACRTMLSALAHCCLQAW